MNAEFKGTKGQWDWGMAGHIVDVMTTEKGLPKLLVCDLTQAPPNDTQNIEKLANAELIADAGNTIQSCGLLPSQLLEQNNEMRELLSNILYWGKANAKTLLEIKLLIESTNP